LTSIFIVEDEFELQKLYEIMFKAAGYDIIGMANNGEEAVQMYKRFAQKPDIILMDHRMPVKTGIEASKEILQINKYAKIIFASADESVKDLALSIGIMSFKDKPFNINRFMNNIEKALNRNVIIQK